MTKEEAFALFERIVATLAQQPKSCTINLVYYHAPGLAHYAWGIFIGQWNGVMQWHFATEQGWQDYKAQYHIEEP
jgi:hypothetical protein